MAVLYMLSVHSVSATVSVSQRNQPQELKKDTYTVDAVDEAGWSNGWQSYNEAELKNILMYASETKLE